MRADGARGRSGRRFPSAARLVAVALALAAPLAPPISRPSSARSVVYVLDRSLSMGEADLEAGAGFVGDARLLRGRTDVGLVTFGARPELVQPPGAESDPSDLEVTRDHERGSDLAGAIRLAAAALPDAGDRRVVLLTDGRATGGDALAEVERLRRAGIAVDAVPLGGSGPREPTIASFVLEHDRVAEGEPVEGEARIRGEAGARVRVALSRDGEHLRSEEVVLDDAGTATVTLSDQDPSPGVNVYGAQILPVEGDQGSVAGDSLQAMATVAGRPRVLLLTSTGTVPPLVRDALSEAEATLEVLSLADGQPGDERLERTDLVVLADVAVGRTAGETLMPGLTSEGQHRLIRYVSEGGGGLLVLGGVFGFGPEYAAEPIARLLPVHIEDRGEQEIPRAALAIMLDRSGSMAGMVGRHTKLGLAVEGTLAAAATLRPGDLIAIASVDEITTWAMPLGPVERLEGRQGRVRAITAGGGGIFIYTTLTDAYRELRGCRRPIRHVIVFSDTADSEEQYMGCPFMPCPPSLPWSVDLAAQARRSGITTSVVGIGSSYDTDTHFLRQLARAGGGRFYLTSSGRNLRRIFIAETRTATRSNLREGRTRLLPHHAEHPALEGLDLASIPPTTGYVESDRRPSADTALATAEGHPILASWRYGLGVVTAWTSDGGERWTRGWSRWDGAGQLMRQIVRHTMRRRRGTAADLRLTLGDETVAVRVEAPEDSESPPPESLELVAVSPSGEEEVLEGISLERHGPGLWIASARTGAEPFVVARVRDRSGGLLAEAVGRRSSEDELEGEGPDARFLQDLVRAGAGLYEPTPELTLREGSTRGDEPVDTWPWLLLLSVALLATDLWLRRLARPARRLAHDLFPRSA